MEQKQKQFWTIVAVAAVVAVVSSFLTSAVTGNIFFGPNAQAGTDPTGSGGGGGPALVKAHSCDADQVCEMNRAVASAFDTINMSARTLNVENMVNIKENLEVAGHIETESFEANGLLEATRVVIDDLAGGNSTAYVCVDINGVLFRDFRPCV